MADSTAARRYARALVGLAAEANAIDAVVTDLEGVLATLTGEGDELLKALTSPVFGLDERKAVLTEVLTRLEVQDITKHTLLLLADRDRLSDIPLVVAFASKLLDERAGRVRVQVATVDPLTPQLETSLREAFEKATGKTVVLETRLDESLIGGLVARVGDTVYDASLRSRLASLKHQLIHSQVPAEA